jgi:hypothetical protein
MNPESLLKKGKAGLSRGLLRNFRSSPVHQKYGVIKLEGRRVETLRRDL